jgi:membrane protein
MTAEAVDPGTVVDRRPSLLDRLDAFQQRHRWSAVPVATMAKYGDDRAGLLANLLAYTAFLALFPLLLILLTVAEIVLFGHPALRTDVVDAALRQFPEVGNELSHNISGLSARNTVVLVVLVPWLVYGSLRMSRSAQVMMGTVWGVPRDRYPRFGRWLPRAVGFLVVLGVGFVAGGAIAGVGSFGGLGPASVVVGLALSLVVNVAMFWAGFAIVCPGPRRGRSLCRGAVVAGAGWTVLQFVDAQLIAHELRHYQALYGAFATFIVLLWWIGVGTVITAFAAELDVVVQRGLWPRPLRRTADGTDPSPGGVTGGQSTSTGPV